MNNNNNGFCEAFSPDRIGMWTTIEINPSLTAGPLPRHGAYAILLD